MTSGVRSGSGSGSSDERQAGSRSKDSGSSPRAAGAKF